ncbi:MAG: hypothetical protein VKL41_00645 [Snowella sp.]|nr:hypothetical protein [Snowella sp.]
MRKISQSNDLALHTLLRFLTVPCYGAVTPENVLLVHVLSQLNRQKEFLLFADIRQKCQTHALTCKPLKPKDFWGTFRKT